MEADDPLFPSDLGEPPQQEIPDSPTSIAFPDDDADLSPLGCGISMVARDGDGLLLASGRDEAHEGHVVVVVECYEPLGQFGWNGVESAEISLVDRRRGMCVEQLLEMAFVGRLDRSEVDPQPATELNGVSWFRG